MGEDKKEYGRLTDLAFTSAHGRERTVSQGRPTKARKLLQKVAKNPRKTRAEKPKRVTYGTQLLLDR